MINIIFKSADLKYIPRLPAQQKIKLPSPNPKINMLLSEKIEQRRLKLSLKYFDVYNTIIFNLIEQH